MVDSKKWSVTYTKHIKQKRKLYHDGFLVLDSSTNKAMLYDESDTLLECRILKNDEIVSSGESLAFNSYLVDVGDIEGECEALPDLNSRGIEEKAVKSFASGPKMVKSKVQLMRINPSQRIIGDSKKSEMNKYGAIQNDHEGTKPSATDSKKSEMNKYGAIQNDHEGTKPSATDSKKSEMNKYGAIQNDHEGTKPSATDWHVMYTTQLTQKAKKYHDGFIRCSSSRSLTRQVVLYNSEWTLLESRFMNRGEELKSGERMEFPGYLVEIGGCAGSHKMGLIAELSPHNSLQKLEKLKEQNSFKGKGPGMNNFELQQHGMQNRTSDSSGSNIMVWQVLYTTQVTQKAKKYHDGFLQLANRGSLGRQVTLYDESRKILNNRFLKKDEVIKSGELITFDGYLVDIGELGKQEPVLADLNGHENNDSAVGEAKGLGQLSCLRADKSVLRGKNRKRDPPKKMIASHGVSLVEKIQSSQRDSQHKPLRNASQILFILQKPLAPKGIDADSSGEVLVTLPSMAKGPSELEAPKSDFAAPMLSPKATCHNGHHLFGEVSVSVHAEVDLECYGKTFASGNSPVPHSNDFCQEERKNAKDKDECPSFDLGF